MPLLASAVGCSKEDIAPAAESATCFMLRVCPEETQAITRAADERAVEDINVFLFDPQGIRPPQHFYVQGGVLERSIPAGRYDVYAVANLHEDMGPMSRKALSAYEFRVPRSYTSLPMSGYAECTVGKGTPEATLTVRRNVAKVVCNISFYGVNYDLKLRSVQMMDMAGVTTLFAEDQQACELISSEPSAIASYENRKTSRTFFLAENCRGEVPGITSQEQKCAGNAPEGATFLRIRAQREGKLLTYDVYLGENNTTNFDVRRNTVHTLDIRIKGENEVDTRVHALEVTIDDDFAYTGYEFEGYYLYEPGKRLSIRVDKPEQAGDLTAAIRLVSGQQGAFTFAGQPVSSITVPLNDPSGVYSFPVAYVPGEAYTVANYRLVYEVTVSNADGYSYTKTFTHDFYNLLTVYTYWDGGKGGSGGRGTVDKDRLTAVRWISTFTAQEIYIQILALENGPLMSVQPTDGSVFSGWYADRNLTWPVSAEEPYSHSLTAFRDTLYMDFVQEAVYIYTDVDLVEISCDGAYRIDHEKQAFVVSIGSRCTFKGIGGKTVAVWWSNYVGHYPRKELSRETEYSFTAWENCTVAPEYRTDTRASVPYRSAGISSPAAVIHPN